ncbi:MAG TPA: Ig-like domain-containing protein, partial [Blastocatellia bacterium]|nr:Ig-like domain-containing protein [Blastocatellia bacterium]
MRAFRILFLLLALSVPGWAQTAQNTSVTVSTVGQTLLTLQGSVPGGNVMTFSISATGCGGCASPQFGTITEFNATSGTLIYTPNPGYTGTDTFGFVVIATPTGGGSATTSSAATITITVTNNKTTITDTLLDPSGQPRSGKVTFILTQPSTSSEGLVPVGGTVSATLNGSGQFTVSVYPSRSLFPQSYYQVWFADSVSLRRELIGVFDIPASANTITLNPYRVTDTNLAARYVFAGQASVNNLVNLSKLVQVLNNGSLIGAQPTLNLIPGSGIAVSGTNNTGSNRVDVTITCATCSGGSLASGTAGTIPYYANSTTLQSFAFAGANKVLGANASNNGLEWKTISGSGGVTVTHSPTSIQISATGLIASINGQTGATQTLTITSAGCSSPTWLSASNAHTLCLPNAGSAVSGIVSAATQSFSGYKKFLDGAELTNSILTVKDVASNDAGSWGPVGLTARRASFGSAANLLGDSVLNVAQSFTTNAYTTGLGVDVTLNSNDGGPLYSGGYASIAVTGSTNYTDRVVGFTGFATNSGTGTSNKIVGVWGAPAHLEPGTTTTMIGLLSDGTYERGTISKYVGAYLADIVKVGATGTVTEQTQLYIETPTQGATKYSVYVTDGASGGASAPISTKGALEIRGVATGSMPAVSPANGARLMYNSTTQKLQLSTNGGSWTDFMPSGGGGSGWTADGNNNVTLAPTASSSGSPAHVTVTGAAHTNLAAGAESTDLNFNLSRTVQFATGALATQRAVRFRAPTYSFAGASTLSDAINVDVDTPTAGTNAIITRSTGLRVKPSAATHHGLWVDGTVSYTGDAAAFGQSGVKIVRLVGAGGTLNSVFNDNGDLSSSATNGF